jgi:hypothetical protein
LVRIINETVKESATLELDLKNVDKKLLDDITQTPTDEELVSFAFIAIYGFRIPCII